MTTLNGDVSTLGLSTPDRTEQPELGPARLRQLRAEMTRHGADWLVVAGTADVAYATGYRSVSDAVIGRGGLVALVGHDDLWLCGPTADGPAAVDAGVPADRYVGWGRFYFEHAATDAPAPDPKDAQSSLEEAVLTAVTRARAGGRVLVDQALAEVLGAHLPSTSSAEPGSHTVVASARATKLPDEIALLRQAAHLAEAGIEAACQAVAIGVTERRLGAIVAATMAAGGGEPRFVVVTSGPRSALADAPLSDRAARYGDIIRFDVGCVLHGYWSDVGRTAVLGEPDSVLSRRYEAVLAGEEAQRQAIRAGTTGGHLFDVAVEHVEAAGVSPYRRHHCGHGIGLEVYEVPGVRPDSRDVLAPGMTLNVETPYYQLGWGGIMVEDTYLVHDDGPEPLTASSRELRVIEA
jgi:Xaa-Pro aminopeptidase